MPRVTPQNRIPDIVAAAVRVFSKHGFRKALVDDIAREAGVSPATLYTHFQNKAHLFRYAVEHAALKPEELPPPEASSARSEHELLDFMANYVNQRVRLASVHRLLKAEPHAIGLAAELTEILEELWQLIERHRTQLSISQISSPLDEFPELFGVWANGLQTLLGQIERYFSTRIRDGLIRPLISVPAMARTIFEIIAFYAWRQDLLGITPRYAKEQVLPDLVAMIAHGVAATAQTRSRTTLAARDRRRTASAAAKPRAGVRKRTRS